MGLDEREEIINLADELYKRLQSLDKETVKDCSPVFTLYNNLQVVLEIETEAVSEWITKNGWHYRKKWPTL